MIPAQETLLELKSVYASYGEMPVLSDLNFRVDEGEIVAVMGPNGAGKSTVLKTIFGMLQLKSGGVYWHGQKIDPVPHRMPEIGITFVPQGRRVFPNLSVEENLEIGGYFLPDKYEIERRKEELFNLFPMLKEKRKQKSGLLSGGQQQALAISRGLMGDPKVLLLDEPTLGLSPKVVKEVFEIINNINKARKTAVVVVEHNLKSLLPIANRAYVLDKGVVVAEGEASKIETSDILERVFMGKFDHR